MHLRDFVDLSLIFAGLSPGDKGELLEDLAQRAAAQLEGLDAAELLAQLQAREAESSTGVGEGVAIPHCFLEGLSASHCLIAQVPGGVNYDAIDGAPVYVLFMLLSPPDARMQHLRLLARISRVANRPGFAEDVAAAADAQALQRLIEDEDRSHAG